MGKSSYRILFALLFLIGGFGISRTFSQQLAFSDYYLFKPHLSNSGYVPYRKLNQFYVGHQQRDISFGWGRISEFLNFKSQPVGRQKNFGWGFYINNDIQHTERRFAAGASIGAIVLANPDFALSVGFAAGLASWGSDYSDKDIYDLNDAVLTKTNFAELDASTGINFNYDTYLIRSDINAYINQLPGNFLSKNENVVGLIISPHFVGAGNILLSVLPDFYVGPYFFYKNTFNTRKTVTNGSIKAATLDLGVKLEVDRPKLWFGAGVRSDDFGRNDYGGLLSRVTAGFGVQVIGTDTSYAHGQMANFIDVNVLAAYPLNETSVFGPSVELGIAMTFGRVGDPNLDIDTLGRMKGSFWVNNGNMNTHKDKYLILNSPQGLNAQSVVSPEKVNMYYEWDDNQYVYHTSSTIMKGDSAITKIGADWLGLDGVLENMVHEVIREGLNPVHKNDVENPDSLEPLKNLVSVNLACRLKFDDLAATFGAEGLQYNGELGYDEGSDSVLSIPLKYFHRDTIITINKDAFITNLELCALKMKAMSLKLRYELQEYYGSRVVFVDEGKELEALNSGKKAIIIKTPDIIPNNPNQKPFQVSMIELGFNRDVEWKPAESKVKKIKKNSKHHRDPRSKTERDRMRDPVPGDEDKK